MQIRHRNWTSMLGGVLAVLLILLTILAGFAVLEVILGIMGRFYQTILLFFIGALLAYLLYPAVTFLQRFCKFRWAAILLVYLTAVAALALLSVLLFSPLVDQTQALIANLKNPSRESLVVLRGVENDVTRLENSLKVQQRRASTGLTLSQSTVSQTQQQIVRLRTEVKNLTKARASQTSTGGGGLIRQAQDQTQIPPSYVAPTSAKVALLASDYHRAVASPNAPSATGLQSSVNDATAVSTSLAQTRGIVSSTPVLLLRVQGWLDQHGIKVDIHSNFGRAVQQVSNQSANILNSAVNVLLTAGNLMVNSFLVLIISFYFLIDGARLLRSAVRAVPAKYRSEATFFMASLDRVLGGYIRGQLALALLAGILGGLGAWVLGVPYAVLIGLSTFVLSLVPVIGAVILVVPPVVIALLTVPLLTALILLVYFVAFMQLVTNVIGPRVIGTAVGIHPLEAMAAALIGFPLAGFLGSFLAVPIVGFLHIVGREAYRHFVLGEQFTGAESQPPPADPSGPGSRPAAEPAGFAATTPPSAE